MDTVFSIYFRVLGKKNCDGNSACNHNLDPPYLLFSNGTRIRKVDLETLNIKDLYIYGGSDVLMAIDFLLENDTMQLFFVVSYFDEYLLYRKTLYADEEIENCVVVRSGLLGAGGIAVDWIGNNLYWIDSKLGHIEVAHINGSFRRTLIAGGMDHPRALALDPNEGLLFWNGEHKIAVTIRF